MDERNCLFTSTTSAFFIESLTTSAKTGKWNQKSPVYEAAHGGVCALILRELPITGEVNMSLTSSKQTTP
jgi:hypothetical protein